MEGVRAVGAQIFGTRQRVSLQEGVFKRGETVLFWHTGGAPALFAYAKELI